MTRRFSAQALLLLQLSKTLSALPHPGPQAADLSAITSNSHLDDLSAVSSLIPGVFGAAESEKKPIKGDVIGDHYDLLSEDEQDKIDDIILPAVLEKLTALKTPSLGEEPVYPATPDTLPSVDSPVDAAEVPAPPVNATDAIASPVEDTSEVIDDIDDVVSDASPEIAANATAWAASTWAPPTTELVAAELDVADPALVDPFAVVAPAVEQPATVDPAAAAAVVPPASPAGVEEPAVVDTAAVDAAVADITANTTNVADTTAGAVDNVADTTFDTTTSPEAVDASSAPVIAEPGVAETVADPAVIDGVDSADSVDTGLDEAEVDSGSSVPEPEIITRKVVGDGLPNFKPDDEYLDEIYGRAFGGLNSDFLEDTLDEGVGVDRFEDDVDGGDAFGENDVDGRDAFREEDVDGGDAFGEEDFDVDDAFGEEDGLEETFEKRSLVDQDSNFARQMVDPSDSQLTDSSVESTTSWTKIFEKLDAQKSRKLRHFLSLYKSYNGKAPKPDTAMDSYVNYVDVQDELSEFDELTRGAIVDLLATGEPLPIDISPASSVDMASHDPNCGPSQDKAEKLYQLLSFYRTLDDESRKVTLAVLAPEKKGGRLTRRQQNELPFGTGTSATTAVNPAAVGPAAVDPATAGTTGGETSTEEIMTGEPTIGVTTTSETTLDSDTSELTTNETIVDPGSGETATGTNTVDSTTGETATGEAAADPATGEVTNAETNFDPTTGETTSTTSETTVDPPASEIPFTGETLVSGENSTLTGEATEPAPEAPVTGKISMADEISTGGAADPAPEAPLAGGESSTGEGQTPTGEAAESAPETPLTQPTGGESTLTAPIESADGKTTSTEPTYEGKIPTEPTGEEIPPTESTGTGENLATEPTDTGEETLLTKSTETVEETLLTDTTGEESPLTEPTGTGEDALLTDTTDTGEDTLLADTTGTEDALLTDTIGTEEDALLADTTGTGEDTLLTDAIDTDGETPSFEPTDTSGPQWAWDVGLDWPDQDFDMDAFWEDSKRKIKRWVAGLFGSGHEKKREAAQNGARCVNLSGRVKCHEQ